MARSDPYLQHILSRLRDDLSFLQQSAVLSRLDLDDILTKLASPPPFHAQQSFLPPPPLRHQPSGSSVASSAAGSAITGAARSGGAAAMCRAVWDYERTQPDDLPFRKGDLITVDNEPNEDWWSGTCNGQSGIFPSNHVERIEAAKSYPLSPSGAASYASSVHSFGQPSSFHAPPPQQQQPYSPYQSISEKQPFQPPLPQAAPGGPPPIPPKKKSKLPGRMGTAFAGGVGFGTGAALASEAVHAIF